MPQPCVRPVVWPASSPATNRSEPSGKKQICALMSRPFGSSAMVVITRWCSNGGWELYASRLLPWPLNTIGAAAAGVVVSVEDPASELFDEPHAARARAATATRTVTRRAGSGRGWRTIGAPGSGCRDQGAGLEVREQVTVRGSGAA